MLRSYDHVLIPEINLGQLLKLVRAEFLVDAVGYNSVRGVPFTRRASWREAIGAPGCDEQGNGNGKLAQLTAKDFKSDQEVRWCPGCGDYAILATVQRSCPSSACAREHRVRVRASAAPRRFPYYMNTYGLHTIHGRAPAIATGLKLDAPGSLRVGRHRRRRRAVDRRQPPDPRAAAQHGYQDPPVQQPRSTG